ncbi:MAG: metallopeptidase family protein [Oscillospiraceae bacterium]|nr:metallopeptidase family protein [Oscillospiraceae bacterium]
MITFDEVGIMLDEIAEEIPEDFYRELNGGIILLPDIKMHPESKRPEDLYILGEYHNDRKGYGGLGRYIAIYYGSFIRVYANLPREQQRETLRNVLIHEFTHHLESLAGEEGLAIKDAVELEQYRQKFIKP